MPEGQQVAEEIDAEEDVGANRQALQVAEVRVHAPAADGNGGAPRGRQLQAPQAGRDRPVGNGPGHLQAMEEISHSHEAETAYLKSSWSVARHPQALLSDSQHWRGLHAQKLR